MNKRKIIGLSIISFLGILIILFFIFRLSVKNHEIATIKKSETNFIITVKGNRKYMSHDFFSIIMNKTYVEKERFIIPRASGIIKGEEIIKNSGYDLLGTIIIDNQNLKIDLFYDNCDDKIKDPLSWNGRYIIK